MTNAADWTTEPREPGWLARLIAPPGGGRPATLAFLLGAIGAAAFVGSLALDWQSVTIPAGPTGIEGEAPPEEVIKSGLVSLSTLSLAYTLGVVAMLGIVGAVVTRPDLALRLRMAATGVTVGLLGIVVAATIQMSQPAGAQGVFFASVQEMERFTVAYEAGIFFGYAAVALPAAAIWIAGRSAARAGAGERAQVGPDSRSAPDPAGQPAAPHPVARGDGVGELSVFPSEPLRFPPG